MRPEQKDSLQSFLQMARVRELLEANNIDEDTINRIDNGAQASDLLQMIARTFVKSADPTAQRNFFTFAMDGLTAPFDRIQVEIVRKGGKHSTELVKDVRRALRTMLVIAKNGASREELEGFEKALYENGTLITETETPA
jgi:hypothetical protein